MGQRLDNATALYMEAINDGNEVEAVNAYTGERYVQHSTPVKDGRDGFIEFFQDFKQRNPVRDIEIVRGFEDGQYVFVHAVQNLNDGEFRYVTADIFDTDDDAKMIEHWDVIAEVEDETASGRTQYDGPTDVTDLDKTGENKELVSRFLTEVLATGDLDRLEEFVSVDPPYAQHNPAIADGIDAVRELATATGMRYIEVHRLIGSGNFVASLSEIEIAGVRYAAIDLFRVEGGKLAEHWDVMEEITPQETWVNGGKF